VVSAALDTKDIRVLDGLDVPRTTGALLGTGTGISGATETVASGYGFSSSGAAVGKSAVSGSALGLREPERVALDSSSAPIGILESGDRGWSNPWSRTSADVVVSGAVSQRDTSRSSAVSGGLRELGLTNNEKASAPANRRANENDADALKDPAKRALVSRSETCRSARKGLAHYLRWTNVWRTRMGAGRGTLRASESGKGLASAKAAEPGRDDNSKQARRDTTGACPRYLATLWRSKARVAQAAFERWYAATLRKWDCIHDHEGAWNDPNPPHYGGLQFDDDFQRGYGPEFFRRWGDAGNWSIWAQLLAAERAYRSRGFNPWPNTARACGLP
jgi:hypothetical protein